MAERKYGSEFDLAGAFSPRSRFAFGRQMVKLVFGLRQNIHPVDFHRRGETGIRFSPVFVHRDRRGTGEPVRL